MYSSDIFATMERQMVLDEFNIKYVVDTELNFMFHSVEDYKKALRILKSAFEL